MNEDTKLPGKESFEAAINNHSNHSEVSDDFHTIDSTAMYGDVDKNNNPNMTNNQNENPIENSNTNPSANSSAVRFNSPERRKMENYEKLLEGVMERGEMCVFTEPEEMNEFHQAIVRMKNRSGLRFNPVSLNENKTNLGVDGPLGELVIEEGSNRDLLHDLQFASRKNADIERIQKILFMKLSTGNDFEMRVIFNRDSDTSEDLHRSTSFQKKFSFFFQQLRLFRKVYITGKHTEIETFISQYLSHPYEIEQDPSGDFAILKLVSLESR